MPRSSRFSRFSPDAPAVRGLLVADAPADPIALARRLRSLGGVALLLTGRPAASAGRFWSFVAAAPVATSDALVPEGDARDTGAWGPVPRWIGLVPYEHARSLERPARVPVETRPAPHHERPRWNRYGAVLVVDHRRGTVHAVGDDPMRVRALADASLRPAPLGDATAALVDPADDDAHADRIREALRLIEAGDLYQVNLARRVTLEVSGDLLTSFQRLVKAAPSDLAAALLFDDAAAVLSTSPELFLHVTPDRRVTTVPIKGTRRRGAHGGEDEHLARELDGDPKERAELTMVVDLERNDLGRVARAGTVRLVGSPSVVTHRTLHHRLARVTGLLPVGVTLPRLVEATFPSGSITGAPKVRAMEVIASLEAHRRGLYTGAIGHVAHDGSLTLSMAIRTLTASAGEAHYHAGGGIVADSDPAREVEETRVKSRQLARLLG